MLKKKKNKDAQHLIDTITEALLEKKAERLIVLDVRGLTSITDYFIICHGGSDVQVKALAEKVDEATREHCDERPWKKEGLDLRRWVVLDYVNVVVNIFIEEAREYYQLERIWNDAQKTEVFDEP